MDISELYQIEPELNKIPGGIKFSDELSLNFNSEPKYHFVDNDDIILIDDFLSSDDSDIITEYFKSNGIFAPVTMQGLQEIKDDNIGSNRITAFYPVLAKQLYSIVEKWFNHIGEKICNSYTSTDWYQGDISNKWQPIGFSPMLRFMKYEKDGLHYPHYDAGFIYPDQKYRTLKSFVLYLTTNDSGATRFIQDNEYIKPVFKRNHDDWDRIPESSEILEEFLPKKGSLLLFDHRLCHDVSEFLGNEPERIIIRGDVLYEAR